MLIIEKTKNPIVQDMIGLTTGLGDLSPELKQKALLATHLCQLGFVNSETTLGLQAEVPSASGSWELQQIIADYRIKYPTAIFVTDDALEQICTSNMLDLFDAKYYAGPMPEWVVNLLLSINVAEEDVVFASDYQGAQSLDKRIKNRVAVPGHLAKDPRLVGKSTKDRYIRNRFGKLKKCEWEVVAPIHMFVPSIQKTALTTLVGRLQGRDFYEALNIAKQYEKLITGDELKIFVLKSIGFSGIKKSFKDREGLKAFLKENPNTVPADMTVEHYSWILFDPLIVRKMPVGYLIFAGFMGDEADIISFQQN